MPNQELPATQSQQNSKFTYITLADEFKNNNMEWKEDDDKSENSNQTEANFDFFSIKIVLVLLASCNNAFNAFSSIFSASIFETSAQKGEQQSEKSTGLLSNMLTFFKSLSGSKPQQKNTEAITSHKI